MFILWHPFWPILYVFAKARKKRGVDFRTMPLDVLAIAIRITIPCASCKEEIHPVRRRKVRADDTRQEHLGSYFYSGTCPEDVNRSCSRTTAASEDIDLVLAVLALRDKDV